MRTGNGSATPNNSAAHSVSNHVIQAAATRREGLISIRPHRAAERGVARVFRDITRDEITREVRIRQFEKLDERRAFIGFGKSVSITQVPQQQQVELFHTPPAAPLEAPDFSAGVQASSS